MNKKIELALQLIGAGIVFFIITYFFFLKARRAD